MMQEMFPASTYIIDSSLLVVTTKDNTKPFAILNSHQCLPLYFVVSVQSLVMYELMRHVGPLTVSKHTTDMAVVRALASNHITALYRM